ncbi:Uncharacterised protein [Mycobacterium tuberculosis]|nr:Uncharacterised protein [Mycobacterium tuberculosis]
MTSSSTGPTAPRVTTTPRPVASLANHDCNTSNTSCTPRYTAASTSPPACAPA